MLELGRYARKHGIMLYALVLMANHYHLLGLDKHGHLPDFMRDLNSFVARILNARYGRDDKFWSGDGYRSSERTNPAATSFSLKRLGPPAETKSAKGALHWIASTRANAPGVGSSNSRGGVGNLNSVADPPSEKTCQDESAPTKLTRISSVPVAAPENARVSLSQS